MEIKSHVNAMQTALSALRSGQKNAAEGLKLSEQAPSDPDGIRERTLANVDTFQLQVSPIIHEDPAVTTVMFGDKEFIFFDTSKLYMLNNPENINVCERTGHMTTKPEQLAGGGWRIHILGRYVNAPERVCDAPKRSEFTTLPFDAFYYSEGFARATLDFFTRGTATEADIERMKTSLDNVLREITEMRRNGMEDDFSKLKNKIDIMGEQVSLLQLLDMQKEATRLNDQLYGVTGVESRIRFGNSTFTEFARSGMVKAMGMEFGNKIGGNIGRMFSEAFAAEADNNALGILAWATLPEDADKGTQINNNALQIGARALYEVFSKIDMSSRENAIKSFNALSGEIDNALLKHMNSYEGEYSLNSTWGARLRSEVNGYFNNALSLIN
jgi:hypothetical protein